MRARTSRSFPPKASAHSGRAQEFVHGIVFIRADDESHDRKPHLLGHPAGIGVAEVAARHRKDNLFTHMLHRPQVSVEVVDDLRHYAGPEHGVDGAESAGLCVFAILENCSNDVLAFVKRAVNLNVDDVLIFVGIKLGSLELAHAVLGREHDDLDVLVTPESRFGRRAHVARRCPQKRAGSPLCKRRIEKPRHELHGDVVEGERRTVRELKQAYLIVKPLNGRDLLGREHAADVAEVFGLIGFGANLPEILFRKLLGEKANDLKGQRGI